MTRASAQVSVSASDKILAFMKGKENKDGKPRLEAYLCPAGVWTNGWGHTRGVRADTPPIDEDEAEDNFLKDVERVEIDLERLLNGKELDLAQHQWDALVSLGFNLKGGPAAIPSRAPKLYAALLAGDWPEVAKQFLDMDKAVNPRTGRKEPLGGLTTRRQQEARIFLTGEYPNA